ncbi:hypothetical protein POM88_028165 [Heracleum sosnowskyi]|uniref:RPN1 N-terminal domain-containing protein n=1 Tax=Heracleum sosnowskyi TaxID=360622 RepID=A0AAD8MQ79_9APIA|nr:hypothetical protein POM88_028165 [Heracleum sosnowskyi]
MQGFTFELDDDMCADDEEKEAMQEIVNNTKLTEGYLMFARDIEVMEPKSPEDVYKRHLLDGRANVAASVESARQNLAATFVNAFVNAGFGQDKLMTASACASLGMIMLWDFEKGFTQIDKFLGIGVGGWNNELRHQK